LARPIVLIPYLFRFANAINFRNDYSPPSLVRHLDPSARDKELSGGKCKVAWTNVCKSIPHDGLGLIELEKFSRALRLRWLWYSWEPRARAWKGMELPIDKEDMALFNTATTVVIGDGNTASFWNSRWM
jgi:hypothetical protein